MRLQMEVYTATGAVSSQAVPPFIPIGPVGPATETYPELLARVQRALREEFPPLELLGPRVHPTVLTISTSWSGRGSVPLPLLRHERARDGKPSGVSRVLHDARYDVYLAAAKSRC